MTLTEEIRQQKPPSSTRSKRSTRRPSKPAESVDDDADEIMSSASQTGSILSFQKMNNSVDEEGKSMTDFSLSQMTYATGTSKPRKRRLVDPMFEVDEGLNLKPVDDDVPDKDSDEGASSMKSEQDSDSL